MEINQNLQVQKKAISLDFAGLNIVKHTNGSQGFITFLIKFDNETTETFTIQKEGKDFNEFWNNFKDTKYLFSLAIEFLGLKDIVLPKSMEDYILNKVEEVEESTKEN